MQWIPRPNPIRYCYKASWKPIIARPKPSWIDGLYRLELKPMIFEE
jgi:hypothetical protein